MKANDYNIAMTAPGSFDDTPPPRRQGPKGLLPSTWLGRSVHIEYRSSDGHSATMVDVKLLEWFPFGLIVSKGGTRTALSWDRIGVIELAS